MALEERFYQLERKIFSRLNFPPEAPSFFLVL